MTIDLQGCEDENERQDIRQSTIEPADDPDPYLRVDSSATRRSALVRVLSHRVTWNPRVNTCGFQMYPQGNSYILVFYRRYIVIDIRVYSLLRTLSFIAESLSNFGLRNESGYSRPRTQNRSGTS